MRKTKKELIDMAEPHGIYLHYKFRKSEIVNIIAKHTPIEVKGIDKDKLPNSFYMPR